MYTCMQECGMLTGVAYSSGSFPFATFIFSIVETSPFFNTCYYIRNFTLHASFLDFFYVLQFYLLFTLDVGPWSL